MLRHRFAKETRDLEMQKLVGLKSLDIAVYRIIYLGFVSLFFFFSLVGRALRRHF